MKIMAIDPGTAESGWVIYDGVNVLLAGVETNDALLDVVAASQPGGDTILAIEKVESYGMTVGRDIFETVWWTGRFTQAWYDPETVLRVPRKDVKMFLCGSMRAKDANIRQALLDLVGPKGTKAKPGPTYKVSSHAWAALGVAVTAHAQLLEST